jgi:hypothetical protein
LESPIPGFAPSPFHVRAAGAAGLFAAAGSAESRLGDERAGLGPDGGGAAAQGQSPGPGSVLKYLSNLPSSPLCSSASAGDSRLRVMFGHSAE